MWAYYTMHEIRVWRECTLSAQLITDALWMGRHGFTESATITHLSHFVSSVCIVLPGWAWKTNYQVISQRSSSTPRWAAGSWPIYSEGEVDRWADETNSLYRISPSHCHPSATSTKCGFFASRCATLLKFTPPSKLTGSDFIKCICFILWRSQTHIPCGKRPLTPLCSQTGASFYMFPLSS